MPILSFRPAKDLTVDALAALVRRGYEGYFAPVAPDAAGLRAMVLSNDLDLGASVVARAGDTDIGFAMLGIRGRRGWIGGMGIVPAARGSGHAKRVMQAVLESAWTRDLEHVGLEVLEQNHAALRVYQALGFQECRWVDVFEREPGPLPTCTAPPVDVIALDVEECLARHAEVHRVKPPWQRERASIANWGAQVQALGVRHAGGVAAWALFREERARVALMDLALAEDQAPALLDATLRTLCARRPDAVVSLVNVSSEEAGGAAMRAFGAKTTFRQREMRLQAPSRSW